MKQPDTLPLLTTKLPFLIIPLISLILLLSCNPASSSTIPRPPDPIPDDLKQILALIADVAVPSSGEAVSITKEADPLTTPARIVITGAGLKDSPDRVGPAKTWTIAVSEDQDYMPSDPSLLVTEPVDSDGNKSEEILSLTFTHKTTGLATPYSIVIRFTVAPVSDWLKPATATEPATATDYFSATLDGQIGIISLSGTPPRTLAITGLTNTSGTTEGAVTVVNLPPRYVAMPTMLTIPNPSETGMVTVSLTPNTIDISERDANGDPLSGTATTYTVSDISLSNLAEFTPSEHLDVLLASDPSTVSGITYVIGAEAGTLADPRIVTIRGLTNSVDETLDKWQIFLITAPTIYTTSSTIFPVDIDDPAGSLSVIINVPVPFTVTNISDSSEVTYKLRVQLQLTRAGSSITTLFAAVNNINLYFIATYGRGASPQRLSATFEPPPGGGGDHFFRLSGGTNIQDGQINIDFDTSSEITLTGYTLTVGGGPLTDPDGVGLGSITDGLAGMVTLTETANPTNTETYTVKMTLDPYVSPIPIANIMATNFDGTESTSPDVTITITDGNNITITGFTNTAGTLGTGMVTVNSDANYQFGAGELRVATRNFNNPVGTNATNVELVGSISVTTLPGGLQESPITVNHKVTIDFAEGRPVVIDDVTVAAVSGVTGLGTPVVTLTGTTIAISGLNNIPDSGSGTVAAGAVLATVTITDLDAPADYTTTTSLDILNPTGTDAVAVMNLGTVMITKTTGVMLSTPYTVTVEFNANP